MVFSSIPFLFYFLPITLLVYYLVKRKLRNFVLFVFSLLFYAWGEPVYALLMLFSIVVNYCFGLVLNKSLQRDKKKQLKSIENAQFSSEAKANEMLFPLENKRYRSATSKIILALCCLFNLGILFYFKYFSFIVDSIVDLTGANLPIYDIALPIGISFYTFQIMSYVIDLYREDATVEKNILNLGTYITMFPQLIAGPIVRFKTIAEQLRSRKESVSLFRIGVRKFVIGLAKKVLLANQAGEIWALAQNYSNGDMPTLMAWLAVIGYTLQIYFDFSGYSDMALGLGMMFGMKFEINFNYPYIASSITDFWRRWHISLSTWFKEYLYIPLGGNRKGKICQIRNILLVWLATGIWHGAGWNFLLWGLYFAILLLIEKFFLAQIYSKLPKVIPHFITMLLVVLGFALFAETDFYRLAEMFKSLFAINGAGIVDQATVYYWLEYIFLLAVMIIGATPLPRNLWYIAEENVKLSGSVGLRLFWELVQVAIGLLIVVLVIACLVRNSFNPFLYFRF